MPIVHHAERAASVAVATAVASSAEIDMSDKIGGRVYVPAGSALTTLTWHDAPTPGGTFHASHDADGNALIQSVNASGGPVSYEIPPSLAAAPAIKIVGNAAAVVDITLKA